MRVSIVLTIAAALVALAASPSATAGSTVVRDHRGTSDNQAPPITGSRPGDVGWGNYNNGKGGGATVRDHRKSPCLPAVPGTQGSILDLSNCH